MGEKDEDVVELLLWKSGDVIVQSSQTQTQSQRPTSDNPSPPPILHGNVTGRGSTEENHVLLPFPQFHQNLFMQDDKMDSCLHHQDSFFSELLYSSTPANNDPLRVNIYNGGRDEAGPSMTMQVGSSVTTESYLTPATVIGGVSRTFAVPQTVCEIAGTSSAGVETEPVRIQPTTETGIADETKETKEAGGSTSRKRSRAAEMHNLSERRRRERINEKMKALQEVIPRCKKSDKASVLDDAIEYMKSLQMQIQMMSTGSGMMPMMYDANMQQFMMMGMNRPPPFIPFPGTPFPRQAHMTGLGPSYPAPRYHSPNIQASDPFRVHLQNPQPGFDPMMNQPQFLTYMNPYSQFVGLHQMQQPPPPPPVQLSLGRASSSKDPGDQGNQPTG